MVMSVVAHGWHHNPLACGPVRVGQSSCISNRSPTRVASNGANANVSDGSSQSPDLEEIGLNVDLVRPSDVSADKELEQNGVEYNEQDEGSEGDESRDSQSCNLERSEELCQFPWEEVYQSQLCEDRVCLCLLPCCKSSNITPSCIGCYNLLPNDGYYSGYSFRIPFDEEFVKTNAKSLLNTSEMLSSQLSLTLASLNTSQFKSLDDTLRRVRRNYNKNSYISFEPLAISYLANNSDGAHDRQVLFSERIPEQPSDGSVDGFADATNRSPEPPKVPKYLPSVKNPLKRNRRKEVQYARMYEFASGTTKRSKLSHGKNKEQFPPKLRVSSSHRQQRPRNGSPVKTYQLKAPNGPMKRSALDWLDEYLIPSNQTI